MFPSTNQLSTCAATLLCTTASELFRTKRPAMASPITHVTDTDESRWHPRPPYNVDWLRNVLTLWGGWNFLHAFCTRAFSLAASKRANPVLPELQQGKTQ